MIYNFSITTNANTQQTNKLKTTLKLSHGIIHKLDILFPPGCLGLVGVAINNGLHQVWPTNPEESFFSDGETISYREHYAITEEPFELYILTSNIDDTYDHTITVRVGILPVNILSPWLQQYDERIRSVLGSD